MDLSEKAGLIYRHPWELSRTEIILKELNRLKIHGKVLDIGCGDSYFDKKMLETFPEITEIWGIDIYLEENIHNGKENYVNSYEKIKEKKFDYVLMMDVLEHIDDDISFMKGLHKYLSDATVIFITVPAFQWLFSLHDMELHHFRRYDFKMLKRTLEKSGYCIRDYCYFYFSLIMLRLLTRNKTCNLGAWNWNEKSVITRAVKSCLNIDYFVLRLFKRMGVCIGGLSLLAVCKQNNLKF